MNKQIVFLDTETTGLQHYHQIFEICVIGHDFMYHAMVLPDENHIEEYADPRALEITNFHKRNFDNAITQKELAYQLALLLQNKIIVAHNVNFDCGMIEELFSKYNVHHKLHNRKIDTITLAHEHLSVCGLQSYSMFAIRTFFGWSHDEAHTAIKDAEDVQKLYKKLVRCSWFDRFCWKYQYRYKRLYKLLQRMIVQRQKKKKQ